MASIASPDQQTNSQFELEFGCQNERVGGGVPLDPSRCSLFWPRVVGFVGALRGRRGGAIDIILMIMLLSRFESSAEANKHITAEGSHPAGSAAPRREFKVAPSCHGQ